MLSLCAAPGVRAQASFTATAESSYRFRGVDLTSGKPDVRLGAAYDHRSGAYGGGVLIVGRGFRNDVRVLGYIGHLGFARRTAGGLTWDLGATNAQIVDHIPVKVPLRSPQGVAYTQTFNYRYKGNYSEVYGGLSKGAVSGHIYLSPNYLGEGLRAAYLDLNGAVKPADHVRLFAHAGLLAPLARQNPRMSRRLRSDLRVGAAFELGPAEVQLAWTTVRPRVDYPVGYPQKRSAVVASASLFF